MLYVPAGFSGFSMCPPGDEFIPTMALKGCDLGLVWKCLKLPRASPEAWNRTHTHDDFREQKQRQDVVNYF